MKQQEEAKKMKRILAIAIAAVIMLAAIAAPAGALARGHGEEVEPHACSHRWIPAGYKRYFTGSGDSQGCIYREFKVEICDKCGAVQETYQRIVHYNHTYRYAQDGGHNAGTRTHTFYQICTRCKYRTNYTVPCAGPPCTVPSSIQYELY